MRKIFLIFLAIYLIQGSAFAQDTITVYFSKNWKVVSNKSEAAYYRKIFPGDKNDLTVNDFYISNKICMTGSFKSMSLQVKNGFFTFYYENGNKQMEGNYLNDLLEGNWNIWYENGNKKSSGPYLKDEKTGIWHFWDTNGNIQSTETYKKRGYCSVEAFYPNGSIKFKGNYFNEKQDGLWVYTNEDGRVYSTGNYKDGSKDGEWIRFFPNSEERFKFKDGEQLGTPMGGMVRND